MNDTLTTTKPEGDILLSNIIGVTMNLTNPPHIDWELALGAVGDSHELLVELIGIYFEECPKLLDGINAAMASHVSKDLQRHAHTLKGCLRYFGDTEAGRLAYELETLGREDRSEGAVEILARLRVALDLLVPELQAYVDGQRSDDASGANG